MCGVTTNFVGVKQRTMLAIKLLEVFGYRNVPVAMGAEKPLFGNWDPSLIPVQSSVLTEEPVIDRSLRASDFLISQVSNINDPTIVAIGPLTNIALALSRQPDIAGKAKLVLMGGMITGARPEWNIFCDPEAARIVFESGIPITMVGLDVTMRCRLDKEQIEKIVRRGTKRTDFIASLMDIYLKSFGFVPVLHDPLALSLLIWPELAKLERKNIKIETRGEFTRGVTVDYETPFTTSSEAGNADVCVDVDEKLFVQRFMGRLLECDEK